MPKKQTPVDDLVPPSGVRTKPQRPEGTEGVGFAFDAREYFLSVLERLKNRDPDMLRLFGFRADGSRIEDPDAVATDDAPPDTERSPRA